MLLLQLLMLGTVATYAQQVVKGKVTDRNGQPVEGASVKEKGKGNGTATDKEGNYSITLSEKNAILVFSGAGLTEQEIKSTGNFTDVSLTPNTVDLTTVEIVGTRSLKRSSTETAVPIDIIPVAKITNTLGQVDLNQILQYVAPSFNSNRQSGADGADHVDPASLRGLGPDQTLVLVNGKRWHQSALVNLFGSRGRGNTGTDLNTIPAAAIERIEILRDGAAAQYGSDAIAGVVNIILKSATNQGTANVSVGSYVTGYGNTLKSEKGKVISSHSDGLTYDASVNYGFKLKKGAFINLTGNYMNKAKTYRPNFTALYPDNYRQKAGDGAIENMSLFFNAGFPISSKTSFYIFGGAGRRNGSAYAYTRDAGSARNVTAIYSNGFDPIIKSNIQDRSASFGIKTTIAGWNADFNATLGNNRFQYGVENTLNASLLTASPTKFDAGGFSLSQNVLGMHFNKLFTVLSGLNIALGTEVRQDQYRIFAGETGSYKQYGQQKFVDSNGDTVIRPGGSQGFPGFQKTNETYQKRNNWGAYVDGELDITKTWMISGAIRVERYSDFGWTTNVKVASRLKFSDKLAIRGSISSGFRAPSLPQINFANTFTNVAAGVISEVVIAPNSGELAKAVGIPALKQETSINTSFGFSAKPIRNLTVTVDGYSVKIKDRVVLTGLFDQTDDVIGDILRTSNIGSAQFFTNAVNTRTTGVDIVATYSHKLGASKLSYSFAANFNKQSIDKIKTTDALAGKEDIYYGRREQFFLLASAPPRKLNYTIDYKIKDFSVNLRFTNFGKIQLINFADQIEYFSARTTTDISFSYLFNKRVHVTIGGANILDVYPQHQDAANTETGTMYEAVQMGMGGAFFFGKINVRF